MGRVSFAVEKPVPTWDGWTDFTDPVYWTVTEGSWDGVKWITEYTNPYHDFKVEPLGTGPLGAWWEGQKPTKFRITFTGSGVECYMNSLEPDVMFSDPSNFLSLQEGDISYDYGGEGHGIWRGFS